MADPSRIQGDYTFAGIVRCIGSLIFPAGSIRNVDVAANAAIVHTKLEHQHRIPWGQPNTAATTVSQVVYECRGATGSTLSLRFGSQVKAVGDSTVTIDVKKSTAGGAFTTILSGVITLNSSSVDRVSQAGTITVPGLVVGDTLQVVQVATVGTGTLPTGVFGEITVKEDAE
jgi:hypothetical protein